MKREKVIELGMQAGIFELDGCGVFVCSGDVGEMLEFARLVELETLERAAKYFDDQGRHIDGGWSEGWYEPQEPGEMLRNLKETHDKE